MKRNELKFKKNDVVVLEKLPDLFRKLEICGIYHPERILNSKGKIIGTDIEDEDLPYCVCFDNEKEKRYYCYYLPEELLKLATAEKSKKIAELKFKKGDVVSIKLSSNIYTKIKECGIENTNSLYNLLLLDTGVVIEANANNILPYLVWFGKTKKQFYLTEELLEPVFTSNEVSNNKKIKIKYHEPITPLENINGANSDWIDLRCAEPNGIDLKTGEFKLISLGVSMKLPDGYEAHIVPRSSTFKTWGLLQTNPHAVIDNSYCSDTDVWKYPVYATRDTHIDFNDRICQFRIVKKQPTIIFEKVDHLDGKSRGGFGSSGIK